VSDKRVGIVTINDDTNYGNRLQNYALQEAVRALGWEPETVRNRTPSWDPSLLVPRMMHELQTNLGDLVRRGTRNLGRRVGVQPPPPARFGGRRRAAIEAFTRAHLNVSEYPFSDAPVDYWATRYSRAITGSDQVWNPVYRRAQGLDFLDFVDASQRTSYAASFGVHEVPRFLRSRYANWLSGIEHLSVREDDAARIVADLTGRAVPVVVDPTMLVGRETWDRLIEREPPIADRGYALRFFLGHPTAAQAALADHDVRARDLLVADLNDLEHEDHSDVGPAGFVAAIARADLVVTDSFHASVFALMYRRPLLLRARFARDGRVATLLSLHGLTADPTDVDGLVRVSDVDWTAAEAISRTHRLASEAFLAAALAAEQ